MLNFAGTALLFPEIRITFKRRIRKKSNVMVQKGKTQIYSEKTPSEMFCTTLRFLKSYCESEKRPKAICLTLLETGWCSLALQLGTPIPGPRHVPSIMFPFFVLTHQLSPVDPCPCSGLKSPFSSQS